MVEDPATGLHRPRDYVRSLEARVAYLEDLLQEVRPEVAIDHFAGLTRSQQADAGVLHPVGTSNVPSSTTVSATTGKPQQVTGSTPNSNNHNNTDDVRSTDADESDVLSNEVALLCLSAAGREPQYFGPSSAVHFSRIISSTLRLPRRGGGGGATSSHYSNASDSVPRDTTTTRYREFPDASMMAKLSEAYFSNIHPQYPFLHQPTFQLMEQECLEASLRNNLDAASESSLFFVLMVRNILFCIHNSMISVY